MGRFYQKVEGYSRRVPREDEDDDEEDDKEEEKKSKDNLFKW